MRMILALFALTTTLLIVHSDASRCRRHVVVNVDVSGSVVAEDKRGVHPTQLKASLKAALRDYLFRDLRACLSLWSFATTSKMVIGYTAVSSEQGRNALLSAVDGLEFETAHPLYYTNWEGAMYPFSDDGVRHPDFLYLVTDGLPTTRTWECPMTAQPCDGLHANLIHAASMSRILQARGTTVVAIGIGREVTDEALSSVSGPCPEDGCVRNWNYYHIGKHSRLMQPLSESFGQRLNLLSQNTDPLPTTTTYALLGGAGKIDDMGTTTSTLEATPDMGTTTTTLPETPGMRTTTTPVPATTSVPLYGYPVPPSTPPQHPLPPFTHPHTHHQGHPPLHTHHPSWETGSRDHGPVVDHDSHGTYHANSNPPLNAEHTHPSMNVKADGDHSVHHHGSAPEPEHHPPLNPHHTYPSMNVKAEGEHSVDHHGGGGSDGHTHHHGHPPINTHSSTEPSTRYPQTSKDRARYKQGRYQHIEQRQAASREVDTTPHDSILLVIIFSIVLGICLFFLFIVMCCVGKPTPASAYSRYAQLTESKMPPEGSTIIAINGRGDVVVTNAKKFKYGGNGARK